MKIARHLLLATPIGVAAALALAQPSLAAVQSEEARRSARRLARGFAPAAGAGRTSESAGHSTITIGRCGEAVHWAHERHGRAALAGGGSRGTTGFSIANPVYPYPDPDVMPQQDATPDQDPVGLVEPTDPAAAEPAAGTTHEPEARFPTA